MQRVSYSADLLKDGWDQAVVAQAGDKLARAERKLNTGTGKGSDALGWLRYPQKISDEEIDTIVSLAETHRKKADYLLCIGIGGSYLGAKAGMDFLCPSIEALRSHQVLFAGTNFNSDYLSDLLTFLEDKEVVVNVISKSGTNTEPSVTFRIVKNWMEQKYGGKNYAKRIVATTDASRGALLKLARQEEYDILTIPGDVGGRYSVLTPVGLFPFAFAGLDIKEIIQGAKDAMGFCSGEALADNLSAQYALTRYMAFNQGKKIETLAVMHPQLLYLAEWWKQLAGESEGKELTGIFPSILNYTADLHSLGQWMQEGTRNVFETFMTLEQTVHQLKMPEMADDMDGFNYLSGKTMEEINQVAFQGTCLAHHDGGVPVSTIQLKDRTEATLGQVFYFFMKAVALSGYMFDVNPFDQPGVEAYKKNMYALFSKPGYEEAYKAITEKMKGLKIR